jgi:hypothetical protein
MLTVTMPFLFAIAAATRSTFRSQAMETIPLQRLNRLAGYPSCFKIENFGH